MILNIALGILLAGFILPLILLLILNISHLAKFLGVIFGVFLILALMAFLFSGKEGILNSENLKLVGGIFFFLFYCLSIGYLTKGLPLLDKLSDGVDRLSFRSGDWINFLKERIANHGRRGFIVGLYSFFPFLIYVTDSSHEHSHILIILLAIALVALLVRVIRIEMAFDEFPSEINEVSSKIQSAANPKEKALVLVKEKKFDLLLKNLRYVLDKRLILKVGDPPGELEVKRYLAGNLDLFVKKSAIDDWSRFDMCIGFDRSNFPELCVSIDVHVGVITVEHLHYSFEFQEKMDKLSFFINEIIERDKLNEIEREKKAKIKLAEEESKKFKGL